jgi:23S rRNA (cytosine1962-C5)-methyltransferase
MPSNEPRLRLRVTTTAEWVLRSGHPWLFGDSIHEQNRPGKLGELAVIYDRQDNFLAIGLYDPESPLRVRVLHRGKPQPIDEDWWRARLIEAIRRRDGLFDDQTTGYRWIHGENDGWPGLVLDRYDATLVLKLYTVAWLPRLKEIVALIKEQLSPERLILRLSRNVQHLASKQFGHSDGEILSGPHLDGPVVFLESGLRFEADVLRGQKTGFFLDQRENRRAIESLARGREVLNAFSFSGGFSLYAARGGAKSITDLDISSHALASARRNFELNSAEPGVARSRHETLQADAFEWLKKNRGPQFDLIILDPPSLARRESERAGAIQVYGKLVRHGIACLREGGLLIASSCSAHVSEAEFFEVVRQTARASGRKMSELRTTGHPPDHPATFREAHYLKCIYLLF